MEPPCSTLKEGHRIEPTLCASKEGAAGTPRCRGARVHEVEDVPVRGSAVAPAELQEVDASLMATGC